MSTRKESNITLFGLQIFFFLVLSRPQRQISFPPNQVLDREGKELLETKKGDGYLFDLAKTAGHVSIVNCGCWHPTNFDLYLTGSNDGTVRLGRFKESRSKNDFECNDNPRRRHADWR